MHCLFDEPSTEKGRKMKMLEIEIISKNEKITGHYVFC